MVTTFKACRNGHFEVVEYVIEYCAANIEQTGLVNFEGENIEGAPPLWCASAAGHLKIVKYLVSKGANVNSTTKSNSTALRAACFDGHVEIVKFLVENNADIEIANRHGHTCLMIACYKGHFSIAKYLIMKGADLNRKSVKGNTALHDCAECGSLEIMKLLLTHSAKMAPDAYQMTPLLAAAVTGHSAIVEYLLTRPECEPMEKISALELLGATFVDKKHDMLSAYTYWKAALERRHASLPPSMMAAAAATVGLSDAADTEQGSPLSKERTVKTSPIEAYDFSTEFMNEKELDEIIADPDDVRMQALLIRERILGPTHPDTTYYIRYRGAVYADCGNFRKCILLWLYALDTQQKSLDPLHPMIQSSFLSFTELFQYMQKQLPQFNSASSTHHHHHHQRDMLTMGGESAAAASAGGGGEMVTNNSGANNAMYNMLNMYTSTVIKILQQAVEEIKRGMIMIKQQQVHLQLQQKQQSKSLQVTTDADAAASPASSAATATNGAALTNQIQRQIQSFYARSVASATSSTTNTTTSTKETESEATAESAPPVHHSSSSTTPQTPMSSSSSNATPVTGAAAAAAAEGESSASSSPSKPHQETSPATATSPQPQQLTVDTGHFDRTLVVIVHFLCVVADSLRHCSPEETYKLKKLVYALVKLDPKSTAAKSSGLIHLASSRDSSSIIKNHTLSSFPSAHVLKLLLECGADPHSLDAESNSPLHLAASNRHLTSASASPSAANGAAPAASSERDKIILLLLNAGAHLDQCNAFGKTPADLYKNGKLYQVVNPINYSSLQCLCAKVIQKHQLPYKDQLTPKLAAFVSIH